MLDEFIKHKIPSNFYFGDVNKIAKNLLGKILVKQTDKNLYAGRIVEVEAYEGANDQAAHSYNGISERNNVMFQPGGAFYVYLIYGVHYCANIVVGKEGVGDAVLLRGVEPITGQELMASNRFAKVDINSKEKLNLTNGPAKLCKAFAIDREYNGYSLDSDKIFLADLESDNKFKIVETTRIGITKSVDLKWRYYIKDNPFVSRK